MRIYLDACCLNRPFDDQSQDRIRLESEAVAILLKHVRDNLHEMVSSEALELEIEKMPDRQRHRRVQELLKLAGYHVTVGEEEEDRGRELAALGFGAFDALHLACAEKARAGAFLTTDDRLLKRALRKRSSLLVRVVNPVQFLQEMTQ
jgi:predicted nucleic acid-binding protein